MRANSSKSKAPDAFSPGLPSRSSPPHRAHPGGSSRRLCSFSTDSKSKPQDGICATRPHPRQPSRVSSARVWNTVLVGVSTPEGPQRILIPFRDAFPFVKEVQSPELFVNQDVSIE